MKKLALKKEEVLSGLRAALASSVLETQVIDCQVKEGQQACNRGCHSREALQVRLVLFHPFFNLLHPALVPVANHPTHVCLQLSQVGKDLLLELGHRPCAHT